MNLKELIQSEIDSEELQRGGYDGGLTIGFNGIWEIYDFEQLVALLEQKKTEAADSSSGYAETIIGGIPFLVKASGTHEGVHYRYIIEGAGLKFLIRHQANEKVQDVRLRYGAESLIGRDFYAVHQAVVAFLADIGFIVTKDTLSRVDMQVLIERKTSEFIRLINLGHAVAKARKELIVKNGKRYETYTLGSKKSIQLCIYDKMQEFVAKMSKSDPVKAALFLEHCVGDETLTRNDPLTRIEFRLGRDALAALEINTVEDLRNKEAALVDWLTSEWFRILQKPKVRGHENTAALHEIWIETRSLFARYFPGPDERQTVQWRKRQRVSCDPEPLEKQAVGCLAAAIALRCGEQKDSESMFEKVLIHLKKYMKKMHEKANEVTREVEIWKGITLGEVLTWEP